MALEPHAVWSHFAHFCRIPRPSKQEAAIRDHLLHWAAEQGLSTEVDAVGNLLIRKRAQHRPADTPALALQAHLDMVCQKHAHSAHDFSRDPIHAVIDGDWVRAPDTTLGADNGIGAALMLALLGCRETPHPPLEALFTVDEEAGMGGAHGLQAGWLQARRMLNLDTEAWGEFYLGCAGGLDVDIDETWQPEPLPGGHQALRITLQGLRGGHSGVDIHEQRGNAIALLVQVLHDLQARSGLRVVELHGGTARNAIPRDATALVLVPQAHAAAVPEALALWAAWLQQGLEGREPALTLSSAPVPSAPLAALPGLAPLATQQRWLQALRASPHGVHRMSLAVPGVVDTSNNLGVVAWSPQGAHVNFMVRSLRDAGSRELAQALCALWQLAGTRPRTSGAYPGWAPAPQSPLLHHCEAVFRAHWGADSRRQVIHAGLECGLIAAAYPGMDIVSFGPTITGAHAPGEAVHIPAVAQCWQLLQALVREV
jgi:dipeptidase D